MASSSSSVQQKHQVFLSFRGEDTRNNFTSHLHEALKRKGIDTYVDYRLEKGEEISEALSTAIEESKISIIVLSKNYASSSWCLDELSKILECKETMGQKVVPIFYHVDPSDVRKQTGSFKEVFAKQKRRFKNRDDKVERWRAALVQVAGLAGHHLPGQPNDRLESTLIAEIVKDISKKLKYRSLCYTKHLVGIDSHIKKLESLLCIDSVDDVRIIGISGMGGIGKTTIAEAVYIRFAAKFEGYHFVNVKEKLNRGQVHLQEELFSKILEDENLNLDTSLLHDSIIDRLHSKKTFIVLDDVNNSMQLLNLLPKKDYFGLGSRIIVISRDKQVFQRVVDKTYEVKGMVDDEALQLFSMCAFNQSHPREEFMELSEEVILFAKGVPLALSVVGCALNGKRKSEWEGHLIKLKKSSDPEIDEVLKISYDGLEDDMKGIFLDIACFFRGERMDYVENILDGCYISVMSRISFLIDKSLLTISYDNMLEMHDLLQLMAWNIIHQESKEPGKRSRLWTPKDICHVLKNKTGTDSVEGMFLNMSKIGKLCLSPTAFEKTCNLKFLKFYYTDLKRERKVYISQQGLEYLPDNLRYLHWDDYPSKSLPSSFCPENLVELSMPNSHIEQLWNGVQDLVKLKMLDLSDSQYLIKIPDLSQATNLESMNLDGCSSLVEVSSSIRYLNKLSFLSLRWCKNLRNFPSSVDLKSLKALLLTECSNFTKFPDVSMNLETLSLSGTAIEEVPSSIDRLSRLKSLDLKKCRRLERLPSNVDLRSLTTLILSDCSNVTKFPEISVNLETLSLNGTGIKEVPSSIDRLSRLSVLNLENCTRLERLPSNIWKLKSLENLCLSGCLKLESFPGILETMECLKSLSLSCTAIEELPSSIERLVGLFHLELDFCEKLKNLPSSIRELKSLNHLSLINCSNVTKFPEIPRDLNDLNLSGTAIEQVPSSIKPGLTKLYLETCTKLRSLPGNIFTLEDLRVSGFSKVEIIQELMGLVEVLKIHPSMEARFEWSKNPRKCNLSLNEVPDNVENLKSLGTLYLGNCNLFAFPIRIICISSLTYLDLSGNNFETIPASIKQLLDLEWLDLSYCKRLQSLPELPPNLQVLNAHSCSSLEAVSSLFTLGHGTRITYFFTNCLKLDQNALNHILAETQLWIQHRATEDLKLDCQGIVDHSSLTICLPGSEIPKWFSCQNTGSSVTTQLPLYGDDRKFVGFVLCAVLALEDFDGSLWVNVDCKRNFKTDNGWHCASSTSLGSSLISVGLDNMFLCYNWVAYDWFSEASFEFYSDEGRVKKCGIHVLYCQNDQIISLPYNARVIQHSKSGSGIDNSDLPFAKDAEEFNSTMIGVNNQDFGESKVEDGTIIKRCRGDYCSDEAEASGSFDPEPMQEDRTIIKRHHDDHHNNEAEPSKNFSSESVEEEARCHCGICFTCFLGIATLFLICGGGGGEEENKKPMDQSAHSNVEVKLHGHAVKLGVSSDKSLVLETSPTEHK